MDKVVPVSLGSHASGFSRVINKFVPFMLKDPKAFFEDVYVKLSEAWVDDLYKASQEDFSTW
ncbi:hypothetical protein PS870_01561 [Pseudomonas fluorescens]|jgi:hypothetical protein|uniref:Uncharacterized protein n=1 Tax=Pseudomonas fluorescens TaxID=294 RepID=A0A5E7IHL2_PSEFL|nr:hypothetical protein PS870_01561 [Pseudomonas fluorescens]